MKKIFFPLMIIAIVVPVTTPLNSYAGDYIGTYCFSLDNLPEEWYKWDIEQIGDSYQISGSCPIYEGAMSGGGAVVAPNVVQLVVTEGNPDGFRRTMSVEIDLTTLNGIVSYQWINNQGGVTLVVVDQPISNISCPATP